MPWALPWRSRNSGCGRLQVLCTVEAREDKQSERGGRAGDLPFPAHHNAWRLRSWQKGQGDTSSACPTWHSPQGEVQQHHLGQHFTAAGCIWRKGGWCSSALQASRNKTQQCSPPGPHRNAYLKGIQRHPAILEGGREKAKFHATTYARGGPHLAAGVHSCWHFKLVIHQQGLNYLVNIILLHSHIMPAWFHHNSIPVIILAAVKNKSSKKCEVMKALIAFLPGSRVAMPCTPAAHADNTGFVLLLTHCCTPTCSNKWEKVFILVKRWLNLLVSGFGVRGQLIAIKWRNNCVCCFH